MTRGLIKSKHRVRNHAEVYTADREVNAMLDLVANECENIDSRFLEPACGTGKPFLGEYNTCCSFTYLVVEPFADKQTAKNFRDYMKTKFFRFCISLLKNSQHATQKVYKFTPIMDCTKKWKDQDLYKHFKLTKKHITYIEKMIKPMEIE